MALLTELRHWAAQLAVMHNAVNLSWTKLRRPSQHEEMNYVGARVR